ncbi:MAG: hypothetical protein HY860_05320 [Chlamydiales bacterium]|nr:hypothetical protein [Chlamydiales bacterium]
MKYVVLMVVIIIINGCSHAGTEEAYRTVPVTNNPNMIPGGIGPKMHPF